MVHLCKTSLNGYHLGITFSITRFQDDEALFQSGVAKQALVERHKRRKSLFGGSEWIVSYQLTD